MPCSRSQISKPPFANETAPPTDAFKRLHADGFKGWTLSVDGLVAHPASLSLDDVKRLPVRSQITQVACEEGWSYVAEWTGTPLVEVLNAVGILPQARYLVYFSIQPGWRESIDMADALHPQTLMTYAMNDSESAGGLRRSAPATSPATTGLQECQVHQPHDGHRQPEIVRQGTGLGITRRRLCVVRRHLIGLRSRGACAKRSRPPRERDSLAL